jgi:predicted nucleotidyltransferase
LDPSSLKPALQEVRRSLELLYGARLVRVVLFGSRARGQAYRDSDVDLMLVLRGPVDPNEESRRVSSVLAELSLKHDAVISCVYLSEEDYYTGGSPLLLNVRREGVLV